jgi:hypothetical protein
VDVPAAASGEQAAVVDYAYTLEFARNLEITNPTAPGEALQRDLEQLERFRNYRQ